MECSGGTTFRFFNNNKGSPNTAKTCEDGFALLQALEQSGYGIINARMQCVGGSISHSNTNFHSDGLWNDALSCQSGFVITGLEVRDYGGQGVINFRILCDFYTVPGQLNFSFNFQIRIFRLKFLQRV